LEAGGTALVTGVSSGLGLGLAEALLERGWRVLGLSRRPPPEALLGAGLVHRSCDLREPAAPGPALGALLEGVEGLDLVVLNAGVLGRVGRLVDQPLEEAQEVMAVNLWANKTVMDHLHRWGRPVAQVVMVSSGASRTGNQGWGAYSLSKAALNMLARLYAHDFPQTHVSALAPGVVETPLMERLCADPRARAFPAVQRVCAARGTPAMPAPREAAERVLGALERLRERPSGDFVDLRELLDPEAYRRLYGRPPP